MEANNLLFRCSGLGHIMGEGNGITEKQLGTIAELEAKALLKPPLTKLQQEELARLIDKRDTPPELPETCKTHLIDLFASFKYNRKEQVTNKYLDKGNEREEDSITLVSRLTGTLFEKNATRLYNNYIQGEPDLFLGESIDKAEHTRDTKTSWSLHTFLRAKYKALDPMYRWQGMGYMGLTGAKTHTVDFCLVNGTAEAILAEKRIAGFRFKDQSSDEFKKLCRQIEINHIFDMQAFIGEYPGFPFDCDPKKWEFDIPLRERHFAVTFDRDEALIKKIYDKVLQCREWMEINLFCNVAVDA